MKNIYKKLITLGIAFVMVFSFTACGTNTRIDGDDQNNQIILPDDGDQNNQTDPPDENDTGNNDDTVKYQHYYENLKSAGFGGDYNAFMSVIEYDIPYVMPSDNGYVTVIAREQSPYKYKFNNSNDYIFAANPVKGYYFAGWEAFSSKGTKIDKIQTNYYNGKYLDVQYNVIGDFAGQGPIRFVRALFTNDESKLVDTPTVPFRLNGDENSLQIEQLPAKIAKDTALYQLVEPAEGYYITDWSSSYPTQEIINGSESSTVVGAILKGYLFNDDYKQLIFDYDERSVYTGRNSTFGIPSEFNIKTQRQADVIPVFVTHSSLHPRKISDPTDFYFTSPTDYSSHFVSFVTRGNGLYLEPRAQYSCDKFYGWYDWDGNLLSTDYVYIDENFDEDALYIQYRTGNFDERLYLGEFTEATDYLRYNPINNNTEWEVAYNHDNDKFIDVLEIPAEYKGKPVTRIADRGFAKSWVRNTENLYQWWFIQSHPLIGRLVVPKTIKDVGDFAFATLHKNVSTSSLNSIDEDTDGDHFIDTKTDITFEVEFMSAHTKVTPYTFSQSGNTFIGIKAQLSQILNQLLETYIDVDSGMGINGEGKLSLNFYPEPFENKNDPWAIYLSESLLGNSRGHTVFALFFEFRQFMQQVAVGNIAGAGLKNDIGEQYKALVSENLQNFFPSGNEYNEQFTVKDANAFAYSMFGYKLMQTYNLIVSV